MAKKKRSNPWLIPSLPKLADLLGVKPRTLDSWRRNGLPDKYPGGWDAKRIIHWLRTQGPWRPKLPPEADLLMHGELSPAIERYRLARAKMVENELAKQEEQLIDRHLMREVLGAMASVNRRTCKKLESEFGPRGREVFIKGLEDLERAGKKYFEGVKTR